MRSLLARAPTLALAAAIGALVLVSPPAMACEFDSECGLTDRCLKREGEERGHCGNYKSGLRKPLSVDGPDEILCSEDIDCGLGGTCLALGGLYGKCVGM